MEASICAGFNIKDRMHRRHRSNGKIYADILTLKWGCWTFKVISVEIVTSKGNLHAWTLLESKYAKEVEWGGESRGDATVAWSAIEIFWMGDHNCIIDECQFEFQL